MLAQIKMEIEGEGLNVSMGSLFHGYLMKNIDPAYAEYFHYNQTNPFTSCIYWDKDDAKYYWQISSYNKKGYEMVISYFLENEIKSVYLENKNMEVLIKSFTMKKTSFEELYMSTENKTEIIFLTPTTFKSNGVMQIFPNISTLLAGVIAKINQHSDTIKIGEENIIAELLEKVVIHGYHLRTQIFYLENAKIKGFIGNIRVGIRSKDTVLIQLLNFLILASEYTGLGAKTSLGMGGVKIGK